jgi:hypothetical protein
VQYCITLDHFENDSALLAVVLSNDIDAGAKAMVVCCGQPDDWSFLCGTSLFLFVRKRYQSEKKLSGFSDLGFIGKLSGSYRKVIRCGSNFYKKNSRSGD